MHRLVLHLARPCNAAFPVFGKRAQVVSDTGRYPIAPEKQSLIKESTIRRIDEKSAGALSLGPQYRERLRLLSKNDMMKII